MISFNSNKISAKQWFSALALAAFALSSCSRDSTPRASLDGDATFTVSSPVNLVQSKQIVESQDWSIPTHNAMTFKACLKDVAKLQPIVFQTFAIRGENGRQEVSTDQQGCLTWNEEVQFDYTQPETFVQGTHTIEGLGPHKGSRELPLAINPWQTGGSALLDLREDPSEQKIVRGSTIPEGLRLARQTMRVDQKARIHIASVGFDANEDRFESDNGAVFSRVLNFTPELSRIGLDGARDSKPISNGRFEIHLTLLERNPDKSNDQLLILSEQTLQGLAENGKLKLDVTMPLNRKPAPKSTIELALRVVPQNAPFELLPEEGLIRLTSLRGSGSSELMPLQNGYDGYIAKAKTDTQTFQTMAMLRAESAPPQGALTCSDGSDQLGFYIQSVSVENKGTTNRSPNEKFPTQVLASYNVCLGNSLSRAAIADQTFEVQLTDGSGRSSEAQSIDSRSGCLSFTDPVDFDYFAAENWVEKRLKITSHEAPFHEVSREFPISLDPWSSSSSFFWDCRRGDKPAFKTAPARIEMIDFTYAFTGRDLEVDPQLNLTLKRHYLFKITPRLKRSSGYDGLPQYESFVDGRYRFKALLITPNNNESIARLGQMDTQTVLKNFKYISSYETEVSVRDGRIIEDVTLPIAFADAPILNTRAAMVVQLLPIDESSPLVSTPFYTVFQPMDEMGFMTLVSGTTSGSSSTSEKLGESKMEVSKLIALGKESRSAQQIKGSSVDAVARTFGLARPSDQQLASAGLDSAALRSLFANAKLNVENGKKICALLKAPASCASNPVASLETVRSHHIEALSNQPTLLDSSYSTLGVSASFSVSQSNGESTSDGQNDSKSTDWHGSVGTSVGGGFNFFGFFRAGADVSGGKGWSTGKSWFKSTTTSLSKGDSSGSSVSQSRSFTVEALTFGFRAGTRQCLTVRLKKSSAAGTMICEEDAKNIKDMSESFYLLTEQAGSSSALRDTHTSKESPWMKAIRGKKAFEAVHRVLADKSKTLVLSPDSVETSSLEHLDETINQFAKTRPLFSDGAFPAVIY